MTIAEGLVGATSSWWAVVTRAGVRGLPRVGEIVGHLLAGDSRLGPFFFFSCRPPAVTRTMTRTFMIAQSLWKVRQLHEFTCHCLGPQV
jgi:hypothetical protein